MGTIKGQNLRIFVPGVTAGSLECVAEALNCTINVNNDSEDSSTKDTTTDWGKNSIVSKSWSASVESLEVSAATIQKFIGMIAAGVPVTLKWDQTAGALNRVAQSADFARTGSALLTDFTLTANNRQNANLSLQFTGTGAISRPS